MSNGIMKAGRTERDEGVARTGGKRAVPIEQVIRERRANSDMFNRASKLAENVKWQAIPPFIADRVLEDGDEVAEAEDEASTAHLAEGEA